VIQTWKLKEIILREERVSERDIVVKILALVGKQGIGLAKRGVQHQYQK
jgi:hypothetical protein